MQKFLDFISTKTFRNVIFFIVFTFLTTLAISSQNFFFQKKVSKFKNIFYSVLIQFFKNKK